MCSAGNGKGSATELYKVYRSRLTSGGTRMWMSRVVWYGEAKRRRRWSILEKDKEVPSVAIASGFSECMGSTKIGRPHGSRLGSGMRLLQPMEARWPSTCMVCMWTSILEEPNQPKRHALPPAILLHLTVRRRPTGAVGRLVSIGQLGWKRVGTIRP